MKFFYEVRGRKVFLLLLLCCAIMTSRVYGFSITPDVTNVGAYASYAAYGNEAPDNLARRELVYEGYSFDVF